MKTKNKDIWNVSGYCIITPEEKKAPAYSAVVINGKKHKTVTLYDMPNSIAINGNIKDKSLIGSDIELIN